jgi:hypothetical protein
MTIQETATAYDAPDLLYSLRPSHEKDVLVLLNYHSLLS